MIKIIDKIILAGIIILVLFQVGSFISNRQSGTGANIENYIPAIQQFGFSTSKAVTMSGTNTLSGANTFSGTTTVSTSYDGFMIGGGVTPSSVATSTVFTLYTHTGGPAICDASKSAFYADSTAFSPSLVWSVGTSTTAIASTNLIASSTVATTTDTVLPSDATSLFVINAGNVITAIAGDITNTSASSTNYGNWDVEYQVGCWSIGG